MNRQTWLGPGEASRQTRRLAVLVAGLLTLARADAGVVPRAQRLKLDRVLINAFGEARHLARGQRLAVERLEPMLVDGDPDRLKLLVRVLLDNALKYTPAEGRVTVALRRDGPVAENTVRDTGVSIRPDGLPRVFEHFYRADPARSRDPGGTGLGLPIARWIARQHGGDVTLASALERGTTATVRETGRDHQPGGGRLPGHAGRPAAARRDCRGGRTADR